MESTMNALFTVIRSHFKILERLLLEFLISRGESVLFSGVPDESLARLDNLGQTISPLNLNTLLADKSLCEYITTYQQFCDGVWDGDLGETAKFWMSYMSYKRFP